MQASSCCLPPRSVSKSLLFLQPWKGSSLYAVFCPGKPSGNSALKVLIADHVGTLCIAHTTISDSQEESRGSAYPYYLPKQAGHSEQHLPVNCSWEFPSPKFLSATEGSILPQAFLRAGVPDLPWWLFSAHTLTLLLQRARFLFVLDKILTF